jgi:CRP-like cAMP-binding protein
LIAHLGEISTYWYFIDSGLVHSFIESGKGIETTWLVAEGEFIASAESFFWQKPSLETIETLEDCILWRISHIDLRYLQNQFPEIKSLSLKLTEKQVVEYGGRVKSDYLASYLGMSRATFLYEQSQTIKNLKNSLKLD